MEVEKKSVPILLLRILRMLYTWNNSLQDVLVRASLINWTIFKLRMAFKLTNLDEIKGFARVSPKELLVIYNKFSDTLYLTEKSENQ